MILCTFLYALHTCFVRYFKQEIEPGFSSDLIIAYQYTISLFLLLPFIWKEKTLMQAIKGKLSLYLIRSTMIAFAAVSWIYALSHSKAVNCIAISCLTPLFILIFAKIALGETLTLELFLISFSGLVGALIIIGPDPLAFNGASIFALLTACLWAINSLFTKKYLSPGTKPLEVFFTTALLLSFVAIPYLLIKSPKISWFSLGFLILITGIFDLANILLIWVFNQGKVSLVASLDLFRVVFTNLLSTLILQETTSSTSFIGIGIILFANYLALNYKKKYEKFGLPGRT
jgi:drug/metabolite transporter (DMT)-like permease